MCILLRFSRAPLALLLLLFTGCLTVEENYTFKKNGSGSMEYVVDISGMMKMMESFSGEDGNLLGEDAGMGEMDMSDELEKIAAVPGIGKVKLDKKKPHIQRLTFSFRDIEALNGALNVLMPDSLGERTEFFSWEGSTLVRRNNQHAAALGKGMDADAGDGSEGAQELLQQMLYKYSFKFSDPVGAVDVAPGVTSEHVGRRELKVHTDWSVIGSTPGALDLRIALDK